MKKKEILMSQAGVPPEELPETLRSMIESDPEMLKSFQDQARMASLMRLKNYEQPDPAMEGRVLYQVGVRIRNGEHLSTQSRLDLLPDWARMVAVVVVMLGLSVLTHREMLQSTSSPVNEIEKAALAGELVVPNEPVLQAHSFPDPFSPITMTFDEEDVPSFLTPEFSQQLESSFIELGLDFSNRVENTVLMPASYTPLP